MRVKRSGKCEECRRPCLEYRSFDTNVDLFQPERENVITADLAEELKAWRDQPIYCDEHATLSHYVGSGAGSSMAR